MPKREVKMRNLYAPAAAILMIFASPAVAMVNAPDSSVAGAQGRAADWVQVKNDKYKWERGGCKYEYKADRKGVKEKYKCK